MGTVVFCYTVWRLITFTTTHLTPNFLTRASLFPYQEVIDSFHLPHFLSSLANFDGVNYLNLAIWGYQPYTWAFFPLYPSLIGVLGWIIPNNLTNSLIISNLCFFAGLIIFRRFLQQRFPRLSPPATIILLLSFPTAFFFGSAYTEGLFFLLIVSNLLFLSRRRYLLVFISAALASLTRISGIFLVFPLILSLFYDQTHSKLSKPVRVFLSLSPTFGLLLFSVYAALITGDPLRYFHVQPAFGANRSTSLILLPQVFYRYLKILLTVPTSFTYFISFLEIVIFSFVFVVLAIDLVNQLRQHRRDFLAIGLNLFSMANLVLPTLTGTLSSIPRYSLLSLSFFIFLANRLPKIYTILLSIAFAILQVILLAFFSQGYFVA